MRSCVLFRLVSDSTEDYIDVACAAHLSLSHLFRLFNIMTDGQPLEKKSEIEHPYFCSFFACVSMASSFDIHNHHCH